MKKRSGGSGTDVLADLSFLLLTVFLILTFILIHFIGERKQDNSESKNQGALLVELFWDDTVDSDVDLWVQGPDGTPVGYSNQGGVIFNLLRDDLGVHGDVSGRNSEMAVARNMIPGEYTINVHLYNPKSGNLPMQCKVVVSWKENANSSMRQLWSINVPLTHQGEERTAIRFMVNEEGPVRGSEHHTYKGVRTYRQGYL